MNLLKKIAKDKLVIMVTHNPELANNYSNRIITLKDGNKLVGPGCPDKLIDFDENGVAHYSGIYFNIYDSFTFEPLLININNIKPIPFCTVRYHDLSLFSRIEIGKIILCAEGVKFSGPNHLEW